LSVAGRPKCGQRRAVAESRREASDHRAPHSVGTSARVTGSILFSVLQSESVLVVPLRSNASTLLAGAPIAAVRRRLKFASLFYDRLFLETGIFRVNAGPHGSSSFIVPPTEGDPPRWQTPAERRAGTGVTFAVAVSPDGRPDATPRTVVRNGCYRYVGADTSSFTVSFCGNTVPAECPQTIDSRHDQLLHNGHPDHDPQGAGKRVPKPGCSASTGRPFYATAAAPAALG
jgi:hypothetical protein